MRKFLACLILLCVFKIAVESLPIKENGVQKIDFDEPWKRKNRKRKSNSKRKDRAPKFKEIWDHLTPMSVHGYAAMTFKLNCTVKGRPKPKVKWFKNEEWIENPDNRVGSSQLYTMEMRSQILKAENSLPEDSGNYSCMASNKLGTITREFIVGIETRSVAQKPVVEKGKPGNHTVLVGSDLTLSCPVVNIDSWDPPEVKWVRYAPDFDIVHQSFVEENGKPNGVLIQICSSGGICDGATGQESYRIVNPMELLLDNLTTVSNTTYSCIVQNSFGEDMFTGWVDVVTEIPNPEAVRVKLIIGVSGALGLLLIVAIMAIYFYARKQKRKRKKTNEYAKSVVVWTKRVLISVNNNGNSNGSSDQLREPIVSIEKYKARPKMNNNGTASVIGEYEYPLDQDWEVDRLQLKFMEKLGEGAFGLVYKVDTKYDDGRIVPAAVKMLKSGHTDQDVCDLVKEAQIMKTIGRHDNIINLLGMCTQPAGEPLFVLVEFAAFGNLKEYLTDRRSGIQCSSCQNDYLTPDSQKLMQKCESSCVLSLEDLLKIGWQVAKGMEFLYLSKCIHRDLAARNVLVCHYNLVKIADFGMARNLVDEDYYRKNSGGKLPVKWMAPEAVFHRKYTSQSDIWSYGILLWEIMTMGESPFRNDDVYIFLEKLKMGCHLPIPSNCPENVYKVMEECWRISPEERPNWSSLTSQMHTLCATAQPYKYTIM